MTARPAAGADIEIVNAYFWMADLLGLPRSRVLTTTAFSR
jgi:hypothetical protein